MINHHKRTPINIDEARVLVDVIEKVGGFEVEVVLKAVQVLELHRLNANMARLVELLGEIVSE